MISVPWHIWWIATRPSWKRKRFSSKLAKPATSNSTLSVSHLISYLTYLSIPWSSIELPWRLLAHLKEMHFWKTIHWLILHHSYYPFTHFVCLLVRFGYGHCWKFSPTLSSLVVLLSSFAPSFTTVTTVIFLWSPPFIWARNYNYQCLFSISGHQVNSWRRVSKWILADWIFPVKSGSIQIKRDRVTSSDGYYRWGYACNVLNHCTKILSLHIQYFFEKVKEKERLVMPIGVPLLPGRYVRLRALKV